MSTKDGNRTGNILEDWEDSGTYRDKDNREFLAGERPEDAIFDAFFFYTIAALTDLDNSIQRGTFADRPAADSQAGNTFYYYAEDEEIWYVSDGENWIQMSNMFVDEANDSEYELKVIDGSLALEEVL